MTEKYYISTTIGDGLSPETAFRPKLCGYPLKTISRTCSDGVIWCLCTVIADDHTLWADDPDIQELEEF